MPVNDLLAPRLNAGGFTRNAVSALAATLCGALLVTPTAPAVAAPPNEDRWQKYVLGPRADDVRPVAVTGRGDVSAPGALSDSDASTGTVLTTQPGGPPASVLLDFGKGVSGTPYFDVAASSAPAQLTMVTSEAKRFIRTPARTTATTAVTPGATQVLVESTSNMVVGDAIAIEESGSGMHSATIAAVLPGVVSFAPASDRSFPAGAQVSTAPGAPSADDDGSISGAGGAASFAAVPGARATPAFRGGFRYVLLTLDNPGSVTITRAGMHFEAFSAPPRAYRGWFMSSADDLNRMWYAGAYTTQLNMAPAGTQGATVPRILDGAKRDRSIWTGDLLVQIPVVMSHLGKAGSRYVRSSLEILLSTQREDGALPGSPDFYSGLFPSGFPLFYSNNYSGYGARAVIDYYRYSGDRAFAVQSLPALRRELQYNAGFVDAEGLVVSNDPDYWQTSQAGQVTKYSLDYYALLREMSWFESQVGDPSAAAKYAAQARRLKRAVVAKLWSPELGAYPQSSASPKVLVGDANALALEYGVHPRGARDDLMAAMRTLWLREGARIGTGLADPFGHVIEPFGISFETDARFAVRDATGALGLMRRTWGQMVRTENPSYTGAFWEFMNENGDVTMARDSLAHGWAAAPTQQLTERVLGITPVRAGYRTWRVSPTPGGLRWAKGRVPTASGPIRVGWQRRGQTGFLLRTRAPMRTRGYVSVPAQRSATVRVDGKVAWARGTSHRFQATASAGYVTVKLPKGVRHVVKVTGR